jgi:hypothetical protein
MISLVLFFPFMELVVYFTIRPYNYIKGSTVESTSELDQLIWSRYPTRIDLDGHLVQFTRGETHLPTRIGVTLFYLTLLAMYTSFSVRVMNESPNSLCLSKKQEISPWLVLTILYFAANGWFLVVFIAGAIDYHGLLKAEDEEYSKLNSASSLALPPSDGEGRTGILPDPFAFTETRKTTLVIFPLLVAVVVFVLVSVGFSIWYVMQHNKLYASLSLIPCILVFGSLVPFWYLRKGQRKQIGFFQLQFCWVRCVKVPLVSSTP